MPRSSLKPALEHVQETITVFGGQQPADQKSGNDSATAIHDQQQGMYCHHYPICVRRVLADDTLVSMTGPSRESEFAQTTPQENFTDEAVSESRNNETSNENDWYAISFISYERPDRRAGFFVFAKFLASSMHVRFGARCHWGKHNPLDLTANEQLYPQLATFRQVVQRFVPHSRFSNVWVHDVLLSSPSRPS